MKIPSWFRISSAVLVSALLASCAGIPPTAQDKPRLVVFFAVDGLPQRQVLAYRDQLAPDGLARFLDRGAWFSDAHYGHAVTATAPGHATMLTGAYPHRTGIINNEWRDVTTGATVYNTGDTTATYIGHKTRPLDGTSPRNLKAETVGDVLRRVDPRSKVIAISGKDRGAILPAGKTGTAYMYMSESGQYASTTFYMKDHPAWVKEFHSRKTADRYFKTEWKPLLPEAAYARSIPDSQPWFGARGGKLPMMMGVAADDAPGPAYYSSLLASPFADILALEFARAAIAGEQLGRDDATDILSISLSGHDYVNHRWSAESRLSHDHVLQLDRQFEAFFRDLDRTVGKDNYIAMLTADHGFMPAPEVSQARGQPAGRISASQMLARVNAELERSFAVPRLAPFISANSALVLDRKLVAGKGLDMDAVAEAARTALAADPAIAAAYTRRELEAGSRAGAPFFEQMRRTWHKEVSGDVQYVFKPFWMAASSSGYATTHGSPHRYDTHVPILVYGPKWVKPGRIDSRVEVADIAPTLARLLQVPAPSSSEGRPLPLAAP
jgi:arylsulfatase A-like enzyme